MPGIAIRRDGASMREVQFDLVDDGWKTDGQSDDRCVVVGL